MKRILSLCLAAILLFALLPLPQAQAYISQSEYPSRMQGFISDSRWDNGSLWGYYKGPELSSWQSIGCCSYAADFAAYVYNSPYAWGSGDFYQFTSPAEIRSGDIIYVQRGDGGEHWFVVLSRNGSTLYTAEGNCRVNNADRVYITDSKYSVVNGQLYNKYNTSGYTYFLGYHYKFSDDPSVANLGDSFYASIARADMPDSLLSVSDTDGGSGTFTAQRTNGADQRWQFQRLSDGSYKVFSQRSGYLLNVDNGSANQGTNLVTWLDLGNVYQQWYLYEVDGGYRMSSVGTGAAVTLGSGNATLNSYSGSGEQKLKIHIHDYAVSNTPANCEEPAKTTYSCKTCTDSYSTSTGSALGEHSWSVLSRQDATCKELASVTYKCGICGSTKTERQETVWSDWSQTKPSGVSQDRLQSKVQYRYRDRQSDWKQTGSGTIDYVLGWPSGFNTSHSLYSQYNNAHKENSATATTRVTVTENNVIGYIYYHWCRGYAYGPINRRIESHCTGQFTTFHAFFSTGDCPGTDPSGTNGEGAKYCHNPDCCRDTYWYTQIPVYRQSYVEEALRASSEAWTDWSGWADQQVSPSDTREVETRTLYRYASSGYGDHKWNAGTVTRQPTARQEGVRTCKCSVCGETCTYPVPYAGETVRVYGADRFNTAIQAAELLKDTLGVSKFSSVIIASGANFADALSGSYLANVKAAPILLAYKDKQNTATANYIKENLAPGGTVYILGGTSAVPAGMDRLLEGYKIRRLAGENRFETNLLILEEAGVLPGQEILVCTATNFADSLSASATGNPILLVYSEKGRLTDNQKTFLRGLKNVSFCIIGGESAVSAKLQNLVDDFGATQRLAASNRFGTSVEVAKRYFDDPNGAVLAYARNYPDGLCGGPLAYAMGAPLILTMTRYESQAQTYAREAGMNAGMVLGGTGLISDDAVRSIFALSPGAQITTK